MEYLDLADYLLIVEAVLGNPVKVAMVEGIAAGRITAQDLAARLRRTAPMQT